MAKKKTQKNGNKINKTPEKSDKTSDSDSDVDELVQDAFKLFCSHLPSASDDSQSRIPGKTPIIATQVPSEIKNKLKSTPERHSGRGSSRDNKVSEYANNGSALSSVLDAGMDSSDLYVDIDAHSDIKDKHNTKLSKDLLQSESTEVKTILEKSVITSNYEQKHSIPTYHESMRQIKKQRRKEKDMTRGKNWFDMPATEMTDEKKRNLEVLQMRRVLDPKRFYKGPDIRALPKYFQMATVVENAADFYSGRIPKKQRKGNLVDELLADAEFRKYNKRKYTEIQEAKQKHRGGNNHGKKMKTKKR